MSSNCVSLEAVALASNRVDNESADLSPNSLGWVYCVGGLLSPETKLSSLDSRPINPGFGYVLITFSQMWGKWEPSTPRTFKKITKRNVLKMAGTGSGRHETNVMTTLSITVTDHF